MQTSGLLAIDSPPLNKGDESMVLSPNILQQMEAHAFSNEAEVCGFVYGNHYVPLPNLSRSKDHFYGDPSTVARILFQHGEPVAIFHTHPNGCLELSVEDRTMWYYLNSTMIVGCVRDGQLRWKMYGKPGD
jgi:proteasome lid subunit RPN8/RPN11